MTDHNHATEKFVKVTMHTTPVVFTLKVAPSRSQSGSRAQHHAGGIYTDDTSTVSDRRLKKDIIYLRSLDNGIRLYSFKYIWSDIETYVGVIAQDLLLSPVHSEAVTLAHGDFYVVDYTALGIRMITLSEWQKSAENIYCDSEHRQEVIAA
jgi:hypothetical protein